MGNNLQVISDQSTLIVAMEKAAMARDYRGGSQLWRRWQGRGQLRHVKLFWIKIWYTQKVIYLRQVGGQQPWMWTAEEVVVVLARPGWLVCPPKGVGGGTVVAPW